MRDNLFLFAAVLVAAVGALHARDSCDSDVYCRGDLLKTVQLAHVFPDSKTFVDMKQRQSVNDTLQLFRELMARTNSTPTSDEVAQFVSDAFESGGELQEWTLPDFKPNPVFLSTITDPDLRAWASDLNHMWRNLSRKMTDDVRENQEKYSIIYVPHGFVIPGGRFKEFYYWDTYWVMKGLLHSELYETAQGVIDNFLSMVRQYGFVPNGGRVYYLNRSQPPVLTLMVRDFVEATGDIEFFKSRAQLLEQELEFWITHRTVQVEKNGQTYTLARYYVQSASPRPESYREDYLEAQNLPENERDSFYHNIKSAAESGWDFSTRWFVKDGSNQGSLRDIKTQYIVPVDLNAFIFGVASSLSELFELAGNSEKALQYSRTADTWQEAVTAVLWHEDAGAWFDYDNVNAKRRDHFHPSNLAPLWTKCYDQGQSELITSKVLGYIHSSGVLSYTGGVPTSLVNSGEQWDLPNAWPPLQHIVIVGLDRTQQPAAQDLAFELAKRWVHANFLGYQDSRKMYEKYDAAEPGQYGGGGEYVVQAGFGWTNGVILDLLEKYGDRLTANEKPIIKVSPLLLGFVGKFQQALANLGR